MRRPSRFATCALALLVAGAADVSWAQDAAPMTTEITVERVKPRREKHETLRFLKANRDFIRARFDLIREKERLVEGDAGEMDPRYLAYREMLARIMAAEKVTAGEEDARARQQLLASINALGTLEARLDTMDRLIAEQRTRLGVLQEDFTGDQRTALMIVLRGMPADAELSEVTLHVADGAAVHVPLSVAQREALSSGGVVQLYHEFAEPREQVIEVTLSGAAWPSGDTGYVTLEPERDRLTMLELDLSSVQAASGATAIRASTWLHDSRLPSVDG